MIFQTIRSWWNRCPMPIWFVCQVNREHQVLGIRGVFLSEEEAEIDRAEADAAYVRVAKDGWPIWKIVEREVML